MAILSSLPRITVQQAVTLTPVVSTTPAYTAGDQVGGVLTLPNVVRQDSGLVLGTALLNNIHIKDLDKQSANFEIWFFKNSPTMVNSDNGVFDITDANLTLAGPLGFAAVGNYSTSNSNALSSNYNINMQVSNTTGSSIYAVIKTTSTPTYTTTSALTFTFCFLID